MKIIFPNSTRYFCPDALIDFGVETVSTMDTVASCKVVLAGSIAKTILAEVKEGLAQLDSPPMLVGFLANEDPAARMYADWTARTCEEK
jgi:hypothetical protein